MRIDKFNEKKESKKYHSCFIISYDNQIDHSGIFKTEEDMDNWLLNLANTLLIGSHPDEKIPAGVVSNNSDELIFIEVLYAINYIEEYWAQNVYYDQIEMLTDVKLKYSVNLVKQTNKYNL